MNKRELVLKPFEEHRDYIKERVALGIEAHRKGRAILRVKDENGQPVAGAQIRARQLTHEFKHGTSIFLLDEMESEEKNALYKDLFKQVSNLATLPFYWRDLEPEQDKPRFAADSPSR